MEIKKIVKMSLASAVALLIPLTSSGSATETANYLNRDVTNGIHNTDISIQNWSKKADKVIKTGKTKLGKDKYRWGGTGPVYFDCSGYTQYLYKQVGVKLPRTTYDQVKKGKRINMKKLDINKLRKGDLLFFNKSPRGPEHVGIYVGNGKIMHAVSSKRGIVLEKIDNYYKNRFYQARRVL